MHTSFSPEHQTTVPRPKFQGGVTHAVFNSINRTLPRAWQAGGRAIDIKDSGSGLSWATFAQDTSILWTPKIAASRSWVERFEITFAELTESGLFYFAVPILGQNIFTPLFRRLSGLKNTDSVKKLIRTPVQELSGPNLQKIVPVKAANILSALGFATIAGEYALNFYRNLITDKGFKLNDFADIVNLSQGRSEAVKDGQDSAVAKKAKRRIVQCTGIGLGFLAASMGVILSARYPNHLLSKGLTQGARSLFNGLNHAIQSPFKGLADTNALKKFVKNFDLEGKPLASFARWFDFNYKDPKTFGLTENHVKVIITVAILGYWDAARTKLERIESGTRATFSGWYLAWGRPMLENGFLKRFGKDPKYDDVIDRKTGNLLGIRDIIEKHNIMDRAEAALLKKQSSLSAKTKSSLDQAARKQALYKEAGQIFLPYLKKKLFLYGTPSLIGITGAGFGVAFIQRAWTAYRFRNGPQKEALEREFQNKSKWLQEIQVAVEQRKAQSELQTSF